MPVRAALVARPTTGLYCSGGSPLVPGINDGEDATAFGSDPSNGLGGNDVGGAGGTGDSNGTEGGVTFTVFPTTTTTAIGGAGGSVVVNDVPFPAGRGGNGITGGGGGAVVQLEIDENPMDLAAPGGGGAGFLAVGLTGVAADPNTSTGYVTFTYSLAAAAPTPTAAPGLPATGSDLGGTTIWAALALLVVGGATVVAVSRRRSV